MRSNKAVTFFFTDIEGSARLWDQFPDAMRRALSRHDEILRRRIEAHGGHVFKTLGDGFCAAFPETSAALEAACEIQVSLSSESWTTPSPIEVRMAIHFGEADQHEDDYIGPTVNEAARLLSIGWGGYVLISEAAANNLKGKMQEGISLRDLGVHRLRGISRPIRIFQALHPKLRADFPNIRSLQALSDNLPLQFTSFVGRHKEVDAVKNSLAKSKLITLTGSGGIGKTRLALKIGSEVAENYPDGVWLVQLASISDSSLVLQIVAKTLGIREEVAGLESALVDSLRPKKLLLILDNCEHLLDAARQLIELLLGTCSAVQILATSRELLGITGESVWRMPPLALPDETENVPIEQLQQCEAVQLFRDRAAASVPTFSIDAQNAGAVLKICRQLDGIPLAIELVASRLRMMSVNQMAAGLDARFNFFAGGEKAKLGTQQTLRGAFEWSYNLLSEDERRLFRRLSVFAGKFALEDIEKTCFASGVEAYDALDTLSRLVDKSLVMVVEGRTEKPWYRLLEATRRHALDKLEAAGETAWLKDSHCDHFLELSMEAAPNLNRSDQARWLNLLEDEHDNLRAALQWCKQSKDGSEKGLRFAIHLGYFWFNRGYFTEGFSVVSAFLARFQDSGPSLPKARALGIEGNFAYNLGNYQSARRFLEECRDMFREVGEEKHVAEVLINLGTMAGEQGDYTAARSFLEEALAISRKTGEKRSTAASLHELGILFGDLGEQQLARRYLEESLKLARELGDAWITVNAMMDIATIAVRQEKWEEAASLFKTSLSMSKERGDKLGIAFCYHGLGLVSIYAGKGSGTEDLFRASFKLYQQLGNRKGMLWVLEGLALHAFLKNNFEESARLWSCSRFHREALGFPVPLTERPLYEQRVKDLRKEFPKEWETGRSLDLEQALHSIFST